MQVFNKCGKDVDSLLKTCKEIDSMTKIDSIASNGDKLVIEAEEVRGNLNWESYIVGDDVESRKHRGKNFSSLAEYLKNRDKSEKITETFSVLSYMGTKDSRDYKGRYETMWTKITPAMPYEIINGQYKFDTLKTVLTREQLSVVSESGLALFDEYDNIMYPIRECAFTSIGKLMDALVAFKYKTKYPLSTALFLAECLYRDKEHVLIYRGGTNKFRPLIGMAGASYVKYGQYNIVNDAVEYIKVGAEKIGSTAKMSGWEVNDEKTVVTVSVDDKKRVGYGIEIVFRTSDIPGTSIAVCAYATFGEARLLIRKNSVYHRKGFRDNGGIEFLFEGIFPAVVDFESAMEDMKSMPGKYSEAMIKPIVDIIGAGNKKIISGKLTSLTDDVKGMTAKNMLIHIINTTYVKLPPKQSTELASAYGMLVNQIRGKNVVTQKITTDELIHLHNIMSSGIGTETKAVNDFMEDMECDVEDAAFGNIYDEVEDPGTQTRKIQLDEAV